METAEVYEPEVLPKLPEKSRNGVIIGPRYRAIQTLLDNGFNQREVAQAIGKSEVTISKVKNQLKKYSLTNPKLVKLAQKAVKDALVCEEPRHQLKAAEMVYDRYEPAKQVNVNVNLDVSPVDLGLYR